MPKEIAKVTSISLRNSKKISLSDGVFMEISFLRSGVYLEVSTSKADVIRIHSIELPKKLQMELGLKSCRIFQERGKVRIKRFIFDNIIGIECVIQVYLDKHSTPEKEIQIVKRRHLMRTNKVFVFV